MIGCTDSGESTYTQCDCTYEDLKKTIGIEKLLANLYFSFLGVGVLITRVIIAFLIGEL
jgi:hypothetical protein